MGQWEASINGNMRGHIYSKYQDMYLKFNWKNILPDYDNKFDHPEVPTFQTCLCKRRKEKSRLEVPIPGQNSKSY